MSAHLTLAISAPELIAHDLPIYADEVTDVYDHLEMLITFAERLQEEITTEMGCETALSMIRHELGELRTRVEGLCRGLDSLSRRASELAKEAS